MVCTVDVIGRKSAADGMGYAAYFVLFKVRREHNARRTLARKHKCLHRTFSQRWHHAIMPRLRIRERIARKKRALIMLLRHIMLEVDSDMWLSYEMATACTCALWHVFSLAPLSSNTAVMKRAGTQKRHYSGSRNINSSELPEQLVLGLSVDELFHTVAGINGPPVPCIEENAQMLTDQHEM